MRSTPVQLALTSKDKNTIEIGSASELVKTLELVKTAVAAGELDDAIAAASAKIAQRLWQVSAMALFKLGDVVATPGALARCKAHGINPLMLLGRHIGGD